MPIPNSFSSFSALNFTQFFAALNDNLYKLLLIFFVISIQGKEHSNTILALTGTIFVIPFIIFAPIAGFLADRFSKQTIIYLTRLAEILSTVLGLVCFLIKSIFGGYLVLFLMATHSAIFSPCKYGIIPEIVEKKNISHSNGILTATTYLAIIFGTFFASFISEVSNRNFVFALSCCIAISIIGTFLSFGIQKTHPQAPQKPLSLHFFPVILNTLKRSKKIRYLFYSLIFGSYFLFIGAYTQLNIIPFTLQSLNLSEIQGGYFFLMTAIGMGIGAFLAGYLSAKEVELGFVPLATIGIALCFIGLFLFASFFFMVTLFMILIGLFGGFYIVPIDTFIQIASPNENRGQNIATSNFLNFIGVIIAAGMMAFFGNFLNLSAKSGFLIIGIVTFIIGLYLLVLFADQVLRLFAELITKFFPIRVIGKEKIHPFQPILLIASKMDWIDIVFLIGTLPRLIRCIVPMEKKMRHRSFFYPFLRFCLLDLKHFSPIGPTIIEILNQELDANHPVCLINPHHIGMKDLKAWKNNLSGFLENIKVPLMPIYISRAKLKTSTYLSFLKNLMKNPITISYGSKIRK
ncbi:MAG: MFS transporter [Chlamydiales bacterium]